MQINFITPIWLKEQCEIYEISQKHLAKMLDISVQTVNNHFTEKLKLSKAFKSAYYFCFKTLKMKHQILRFKKEFFNLLNEINE